MDLESVLEYPNEVWQRWTILKQYKASKEKINKELKMDDQTNGGYFRGKKNRLDQWEILSGNIIAQVIHAHLNWILETQSYV